MLTMRRYVIPLAAIAVLGAIALWRLSSDVRESPLGNPPAEGVGVNGSAPASGQGSQTAHVVSSAPVTASGTAPPTPRGADWYGGFAARDLYAEVLPLRDAKAPGSYAAAVELRSVCIDASLALLRAPPLDANEATLSARVSAKQELEVRCSRLLSEGLIQLEDVAGDPWASRYREALRRTGSYPYPASAETFMQDIRELASQGQFARADAWIIASATWRGQSWADRRDDFSAAVRLAQWLSTASPDMGQHDIRLLVRCYRTQHCSASYERFNPEVPEDRRIAIRALAEDMAEAFRTGNVEAWGVTRPPRMF